MEGIQSGDLDSILLSSIPGLEGIGGDLTLADVAELSLEEIEEIMATLEEGNDEFDNVAENMMNIEDVMNDNPMATSLQQVKDDAALQAEIDKTGGLGGNAFLCGIKDNTKEEENAVLEDGSTLVAGAFVVAAVANQLRVVLLSMSGGSKSTQMKAIVEDFGVVPVSLKDLLKDEVKAETNRGVKIQGYQDSNIPIPDDLLFEVVQARLSQDDCRRSGYVLSGFPSTVKQVQRFHEDASIAANKCVALFHPELPASKEYEDVSRAYARLRREVNEEQDDEEVANEIHAFLSEHANSGDVEADDLDAEETK
jgi:adenylate kinase